MKLNSKCVYTASQAHLKILEAAEKLGVVHDYIPIEILKNKAQVSGKFAELAMDMVQAQFLTYKNLSYKLSISGLDCLAINKLRSRGLQIFGSNIGIGKESDIYYGVYKDQKVAIKIHRLGRTSYQKLEERKLKDNTNWFTMNKENCRKEAHFLEEFADLPVPKIIDYDRHVIVMELLDYDTLYKVRIENPEVIANLVFEFLHALWNRGYAHGDLNEFNIMVNGEGIRVLDFPQCISTRDPRAADYLRRDIECIHKYFWKKNFYVCDDSILQEIMQQNNIKIEIDRK
ncbi:RIO kinase 2 [Enteropsectra breve]|nr:RIO kinase 2 [Enteropsectra breve]